MMQTYFGGVMGAIRLDDLQVLQFCCSCVCRCGLQDTAGFGVAEGALCVACTSVKYRKNEDKYNTLRHTKPRCSDMVNSLH
uniref:Uncharacterized protein n=1 Tax=Peronospora matthiolae TaxID=2874970 RepID=A0AAV1UNW8_9STRA